MNQMKSQGTGGQKVEDIIKKWWGDYDGLESKHDYIQWLFPIHESSSFNYQSQALQRHEVRKIRRSPKATANFLRCYDLILDFFGFVVANKSTGELRLKDDDADGRDDIEAGSDFAAMARRWSEDQSAPQGGQLPEKRVPNLATKVREAIADLRSRLGRRVAEGPPPPQPHAAAAAVDVVEAVNPGHFARAATRELKSPRAAGARRRRLALP